MAQESRVKKTLLNARVNLIFYFITLALSFFSRKIFLDGLGADFIGLTGSLGSLLGFLNLAELGIGSAIGYVLYKPIFEQNHEKINEIISVFGYLYRWVGVAILAGGLILAGFFPMIYPDTGFDLGIIYFAYFSFLFSSLIGYFVNYRQTLLGADQRNYVVTAYFQTAGVIKTLIQMALAYYTGNYYLWVVVELVFGILHAVILNWKINQVYPWLKTDVRSGKELRKKYPEIIKYTKQLFVHKMSGFVYWQISPFLIYAFVSLQTVAYYGNYTMITQKITALLNNFLGSSAAGVGNLIAEGNKDKVIKVYWELMVVRFIVIGVAIYSTYKLLPAFISLWLGDGYLLSESVLLLSLIIFFMSAIRGTTDEFIVGYGLFYDIWAPLAETIINIISSIVGGYLWGLEGILIGNVISTALIIYGWKPYFLFSKGFKLSVSKFWSVFIAYLAILSASIFATEFILTRIDFSIKIHDKWVDWILYAVIITAVFGVIYSAMFLIFTKSAKSVVARLIKKN